MSTDDLMEIHQLLARYAVSITQGDIDGLLAVFTPDGSYSAFGDTCPLAEFPALVAAAPKGLFLTGTVLLATAEQRLYDTARDLLPGVLELTESPWRHEYLYSRAATIYGGTAEIQRNIIARRLLDLGAE